MNLVPPLSALLLSAIVASPQQPRQNAPSAQEAVAPAPPAAFPGNTSGPRIQFASRLYEFGQKAAGAVVSCTYVFTNCGDQVLKVTDVRTSCGCATATDWSKELQPGKSGIIPVQLKTANLDGPVSRTVRVMCNDPKAPTVELQLKGTVWHPVEVTPSLAVLNVPPDSQAASTVVRIINHAEDLLVISALESTSRAISVQLRTNQPGKEFQLVIATVPPLAPGQVQSTITLKTSSTNAPVLTVNAVAVVPPIISLTPAHLLLPPGPLSDPMVRSVMIKNNSANPIQISDAAINAKDVDVSVVELQPGRAFRARLAFPEGFEIAQGRQVEFSFKSSHSQCPLVRVPITQAARTTKAPAASSMPNAPATDEWTIGSP